MVGVVQDRSSQVLWINVGWENRRRGLSLNATRTIVQGNAQSSIQNAPAMEAQNKTLQ